MSRLAVGNNMKKEHMHIIRIANQSLIGFTYDKEFGCVYFRFSENKVAKTVEFKPDVINVDFDKDGLLIGIELIGVKKLDVGLKQALVEISNIYHTPAVKDLPKIVNFDKLVSK